jgi:hypothetical protein
MTGPHVEAISMVCALIFRISVSSSGSFAPYPDHRWNMPPEKCAYRSLEGAERGIHVSPAAYLSPHGARSRVEDMGARAVSAGDRPRRVHAPTTSTPTSPLPTIRNGVGGLVRKGPQAQRVHAGERVDVEITDMGDDQSGFPWMRFGSLADGILEQLVAAPLPDPLGRGPRSPDFPNRRPCSPPGVLAGPFGPAALPSAALAVGRLRRPRAATLGAWR